MKTIPALTRLVLNLVLLLAGNTVYVPSTHPTDTLLWRMVIMKSRLILNISFNSILLLALILGTGAVSSVTALGNVTPPAAVNSLIACSTLTFAPPTNYTVGDFAGSVAVGYFNSDGYQDLAVINLRNNSVSILLGDGAGSFGTATSFAAGSIPGDIEIGDFNRDGNQDLVIVNAFDGVSSNIGVSILLGNGTGSFAAPTFFSSGGSSIGSVAVGDFNEDGNQDLAIANGLTDYNQNISILLGTGTGSFGTATTFAAKVYTSSVAVADFNRDGHQDLAIGPIYSGNKVSILLGNGTGSFGEATVFPVGVWPFDPSYITVGDFNGDGNEDLATMTNDHYVSILFGNGVGSFAAPMNFDTVDTFPYGLVVGDFNGDGKQDLATANGYTTANVSILLGDGMGSFAAALDFPTGAGTVPIIIAAGDFNTDGKQDLVTANTQSNNISILLNTCQAAPGEVILVNAGPDQESAEGEMVELSEITFNDSVIAGAYTATMDWGDGSPIETGTLEADGSEGRVHFNPHMYGDNGIYTVKVCVSSDGMRTACDTADVNVSNVFPSARIDISAATLINGIPIFFARAGMPIDFSVHATDPGSDDLVLYWESGDGSPISETAYLVNPPNADLFPSPSIQPRDVMDSQTHTFELANVYTIKFWAEDDDGGVSPVGSAVVIVTGNVGAGQTKPAGYWQHQFSQKGKIDLDEATLLRYLAITDFLSSVFNETRDASTAASARDVLFMQQKGGDARKQFDRELLTVWLNFANGAIDYHELLDIKIKANHNPENTFADIVTFAEMVRVNPSATEAEIREQKNVLHHINQ